MARLFANSSNCDSDSDSDSVGNSNSTRSSFLAVGKGGVVVVILVAVVAAAAIVVIIIARMVIMILGIITTARRMILVMWHAGPFPKPNSLLAFSQYCENCRVAEGLVLQFWAPPTSGGVPRLSSLTWMLRSAICNRRQRSLPDVFSDCNWPKVPPQECWGTGTPY